MAKAPSTASRATKQRAAIAAALEQAETFQSAQELFETLRLKGHRIGLTTVYRNLQSMVTRGDVDLLRREDGEAIYRHCDTAEHHHHLVCRSCGVSVEIENEKIEDWADTVSRRHGFSDVTHDLELFGTCGGCSTGS
jgi:Fur family ferric uptake transcriptional regulator